MSSIATTPSPSLSPHSSRPSTPTPVSSCESSFDFDVQSESTSSKTIKVAGAIFCGVLAAVGAVLLGLGTVASLGTLPVALIIGATIAFGVASIVLGIMAARDKPVEFIEVEEAPVKLPPGPTAFHETKVYPKLSAFVDEGNKFFDEDGNVVSKPYVDGLHPHFVRDCDRCMTTQSIEGRTFAEMVFVDDPELQPELQSVIQSALRGAVRSKLGEGTDLLPEISVAMTQNASLMLKNSMRDLANKKFRGSLVVGGTDPKINYTYGLTLSSNGATAARILIEGSGKFTMLDQEDGRAPKKLEQPCDYQGTMTICIDRQGQSTVTTQVVLTPDL